MSDTVFSIRMVSTKPGQAHYDGALPTDTTWSGVINGTLHRTFDNDFRLASESVNGSPPVTYQYDADGLLIAAGALQIQRDPATGFQTGATLGGITESRTYSAYGEEASYTSSFGYGIIMCAIVALSVVSTLSLMPRTRS